MAKQTKTKVVTGIVRLAYVNIWEPKTSTNGKARYGCMLIIPKTDTETVEAIQRAIDCAIQEGIGKFGGKVAPRSRLKLPLRDGDLERSDEAFKGCWFINASSKVAPQVVDRQLRGDLAPEEIYSGVYARVSIKLYAYSVSGNKGVACGLRNVQKVHDGEVLRGRVSASSEFSVIDDDDQVVPNKY